MTGDITVELAPTKITVLFLGKLDALIFYALLGLIPLTAIPYGAVEPWWQAAFECTVFLLAALWMLESGLTGNWQLNHWKLVAPLLVLVVFAWLQTISWREPNELAGVQGSLWQTVSADPHNTRRFALKLLSLVFTGLMLLRYTSSRSRLRALLAVILATGVASALFGLLRQTAQTEANGFILPLLPPHSGYGQFINRNHFAYLMEMTLGLAVGLMAVCRVASARWLHYAALSLPLWLALVLANSRGGVLSLLCLILLAAWLRCAAAPGASRRWCWKQATLAFCLLMVFISGSLWVGGDPLRQRLEAASAEIAPMGVGRVEVWRATWKLIQDHWLVGVGFGGYWVAVPTYHEATGQLIPQEAHNDYLELLASGGVIGSACAVWFALLWARCAWRQWRQIKFGAEARVEAWTEVRAARIGALAGLFGVAVHSCFDFGLHITVNALMTTALLVIAARAETPAERMGKKLTF